MAETPNQSNKRRIVKNPETFRERAIKASDESDKPKKPSIYSQTLGKVVGVLLKPLAKIGSRLVKFRPIRLIGKILLPSYFRGSWQELKQVRWPNRTESRQLTFAVLLFAVVFGITIAIVDYGLDKIFRNVLLK